MQFISRFDSPLCASTDPYGPTQPLIPKQFQQLGHRTIRRRAELILDQMKRSAVLVYREEAPRDSQTGRFNLDPAKAPNLGASIDIICFAFAASVPNNIGSQRNRNSLRGRQVSDSFPVHRFALIRCSLKRVFKEAGACCSFLSDLRSVLGYYLISGII